MKNPNVVIVYVSRYGHTKLLAEAVAEGAREAGAEVTLITATDAAKSLETIDRADAVIFGSPTYMGNMAWEMKAFIEAGVGRWVSRAWKDKIAGCFVNSSNFSGDKLNTQMGLMVSAMQQGMIWVSLEGLPGSNEPETADTQAGPSPEAINRVSASVGAMAASFHLRTPDAPVPGDLATAKSHGKRITEVTARFLRGSR